MFCQTTGTGQNKIGAKCRNVQHRVSYNISKQAGVHIHDICKSNWGWQKCWSHFLSSPTHPPTHPLSLVACILSSTYICVHGTSMKWLDQMTNVCNSSFIACWLSFWRMRLNVLNWSCFYLVRVESMQIENVCLIYYVAIGINSVIFKLNKYDEKYFLVCGLTSSFEDFKNIWAHSEAHARLN